MFYKILLLTIYSESVYVCVYVYNTHTYTYAYVLRKFKSNFRRERLLYCPYISSMLFSDDGIHQLGIYSFDNYLPIPRVGIALIK